MAVLTPIRIQRKNPGAITRFWWVAAVAAVLGAAAWYMAHPHKAGSRLPAGYIASADTLDMEYEHYLGKILLIDQVKQRFLEASARAAAGDYAAAAKLLEADAKEAPVPMIFNDLGVLYTQLKDNSRAANAFRDALSRDLAYRPVRDNLRRLNTLTAASAEPVSREVERNGVFLQANFIALGRAVEAEIAAGQDDIDWFRFVAPPPPRDTLDLEIRNNSKTLIPMVAFYDSENRLLDWNATGTEPGAPLNFHFSPEPNSVIYVQVRGSSQTAGAYTLTVRALKAFDAYEPNDDIFSATRISLGQTIDANFIDSAGSDYYSFFCPRTGTVTVEIRNRSKSLIPALSTFTPDKRFAAFGPDVKKRGENLKYEMHVEANQTYYIQVWPAKQTSGDYSLIVK